MKLFLVRLLLFLGFIFSIHAELFVLTYMFCLVAFLVELRVIYVTSKNMLNAKLDVMCSITNMSISDEEKKLMREKVVESMTFIEKKMYYKLRGEKC